MDRGTGFYFYGKGSREGWGTVHLNKFGYEKFYDKIFDFVQVTHNLRRKSREEEADNKNSNEGD